MLCSANHFRRLARICIAALAMLALGGMALHAQLPTPPATTEDALRQMLDQAGIVFAGQVTAIRHIGPANGSTGTIEIDFAIADAVLGVSPNTTYTLREWTGLASNGDSTFVIGRRYLMFLHAPGPSGLSSPVGGPDGAIPILPTAEPASPNTPDAAGLAAQTALAQTPQAAVNTVSAAPRSPAHTTFRLGSSNDSSGVPSLAASAPAIAVSLASANVDLRWIATRVLTPLAYAPASTTPAEAHPIVARANLISADTAATFDPITGVDTTAAPTVPAAPALSQPPSSATYSTVLAMLRAWNESGREEDHAR